MRRSRAPEVPPTGPRPSATLFAPRRVLGVIRPTAEVIGSLTMIYDHHTGDLTRKLDSVQHDYTAEIVSTMHVHLDHHNCLEILALKGRGERVYELADKLLGLRGVKHGELTCAATEKSLER